MSKLKKSIIVALAAFISAMSGYTIAPEVIEAACIKLAVCEDVK
jgi:hypothetical protein